MTSTCNVFMFYLIFEFLMLVFVFHVSSVISRTNEIYIEKIINNSKKIKKKEKPSHIVLLCQILTSPLDKQVLHSFLCHTPALPRQPSLYLVDKWWAWTFLARGRILQNSLCISNKITCCVSKSDFFKKSWGSHDGAVVQI
jgi:hypothetical protein